MMEKDIGTAYITQIQTEFESMIKNLDHMHRPRKLIAAHATVGRFLESNDNKPSADPFFIIK